MRRTLRAARFRTLGHATVGITLDLSQPQVLDIVGPEPVKLG
jgi:hypothetical protein